MTKNILMLVSFMLISQNSFAASYVILGFGKDGATGLSSPVADSAGKAQKIFEQVGPVHVDDSKLEIELEIKKSGLSLAFSEEHSKVLSTSIKGKIDNNLFPLQYGDIQIAGRAANLLFETLSSLPDTGTQGRITRKIQNISCSQDTRLKFSTCILTDVTLVQFTK